MNEGGEVLKGLYNTDTGVEERAQNPSPSRLSLRPDTKSNRPQGLQNYRWIMNATPP